MNHPEPSPLEQLTKPIQFLKGVGPQRAELLARLDLHTAMDLLFFFPRSYREMHASGSLADAQPDVWMTVRGTVEEIDTHTTQSGSLMVGALVRCDDDFLRAVWFNQPYIRDKLTRGHEMLFSGKLRRSGLRWEMAHPQIEPVGDEEEEELLGALLPIYRLTEGLKPWHIRRIVAGAVQQFADLVEEVFPQSWLDWKGLMPIGEALRQIHEPTDRETLDRARRRFVYQELFTLQFALAIRHRETEQHRAEPLPITAQIDARIRRLFPFALTGDQERAIADITADMGRSRPMNRLLQGDVGSGKTVVAVYAMLLAVACGKQAVLMAPTEVLARQHYHTLKSFLARARVRVGLLTGTLSSAQRKTVLSGAEWGDLDLLIGTQALIMSEVRFARLGLVIIDEQHRFGVRQRAMLRGSGEDPHYLVMTATPIPRTVAMTIFGDLDVSTIREGPPGRQPVYTYLPGPELRQRWWNFFREKVRKGRQGYVIAPLVEDSEELEVSGVTELFDRLREGPLAGLQLDKIHGRLSSEEKETAMERFRRGRTQVLVATSVVEVGVDVPNATLMTIEHGERFGLAQLHQLRGRVRRGKHPGYVAVFADPQTDEARARLEAFEKTSDGFELAELDFRLRGPGDLFGTSQHGLPPLRIADLIEDRDVLEDARDDAVRLTREDPLLRNADWKKLHERVMLRYGKALDLGDVG